MKANYQISIPRRTFWRVILPLTLCLCCTAALAGFFLVDRFVMPRIVHVNRGWVHVPDITGNEYEAARQKLYGAGLRLIVKDRVYSNAVEQNCVIMQDPPRGTRINTAERRGVEAVMSKGPEVARIPDLANLAQHQAKRALLKAGFSVGKITQRFDPKIGKDLFIASTPKPGSMASREVPVALIISKGPEPTHAEVPSIIGETLAAAKQRLEEAGLKAGTIETRYLAQSQPGIVISQSAAPGKRAELGSAINLVVSARSAGGE